MTPGPSIYYECNSCKNTIEITTIYSGNNFGASYWTDGYVFSRMLPDSPRHRKCPHCGKLFWTKDLKKLGEVDWFWGEDEIDKSWGKPKIALEFEATDYLSTLESNFARTNDEKKYLRTYAWWKFNDLRRWKHPEKRFYRSSIFEHIPEITFYENLEVLEKMLDESIQSERLQKAEILRELGRFDESKNLLEFGFDERLIDAKEFLEKCNEEKISTVREMTGWLNEKRERAQELYTLLKNKYIEDGIDYVKSQAIAKGMATEENFLSVIHNLTVKEFLELRGSYKELFTIHFPKQNG